MTLGDSFVRVAHGTSVVALMSLVHLLRFSRQSSSSPVFFIAWLNKPEVTRLERAAVGADFRTATPAKIRYQRRDRAPARRTAPGASNVRMRRQAVVDVLGDAMVGFARLVRRVDVNDDERQVVQMMQQLVAHLGGDLVGLRDGQPRLDGDVELGVQAMPEPARPHLRHLFDLGYMPGGMSNFMDDVR